MALRLGDIYDGQLYNFVPGEDFIWPVDQMVVGFEEADEETDEPLGPYESPALVPLIEIQDRPDGTAKWSDNAREKHHIGMGWSSLAIAMSTLTHMTGGKKHQFQRPQRGATPDIFEFQFTPDEGGWPGGRL